MRSMFAVAGIFSLAMAAQASATLVPFSDNFDNEHTGANGPGINYTVWPTWPLAKDHANGSSNENHTPGGTTSFKVDPTYHYGLADYHDFGTTAGAVTASVWVWDDNSFTGTSIEPVGFYFGLYGDALNTTPGTGPYMTGTGPAANSDFELIGLANSVNSGNTYVTDSYSAGIVSTGISRTAAIAQQFDPGTNWVQLTIHADSLASGGLVSYYINNNLVATSTREAGQDLHYVFMGSPSGGSPLQSNYVNFYFDDVSITPEPGSAGLTLLVLLPAFLRRKRRTSAA